MRTIKGSPKNLWCDMYRGSKSDFKMFNKWLEDNNIIARCIYFTSWLEITKNGKRGVISSKRIDTSWPNKDHTTMWKKKDGSKIFICHSYDLEGNNEELNNWASERKLEVIYHGRDKSWYYPGATFMYEIKTNE